MSEKIKYCPKCGEQVPIDYKFCHSCGFNFETQNIAEEINREKKVETSNLTDKNKKEKNVEAPIVFRPVESQVKKFNGKTIGVLVGIAAIILVGVYFFISRGSALAGSYKYEGSSSEEDIVTEISDENRMSYTFQDRLEGVPYTITIHFNLESLDEERYVITETDGFYIDIVAEGSGTEVEEFEELFTDQTYYSWSSAFESVIENEGNSIAFSSRRISAEELESFELWSIEDFVLIQRNDDLYIHNQLFIKQ